MLQQRLKDLLDQLDRELNDEDANTISGALDGLDFIGDASALESEIMQSFGEMLLLALDLDLATDG